MKILRQEAVFVISLEAHLYDDEAFIFEEILIKLDLFPKFVVKYCHRHSPAVNGNYNKCHFCVPIRSSIVDFPKEEKKID